MGVSQIDLKKAPLFSDKRATKGSFSYNSGDGNQKPWKVIVIDDDKEIHIVTQLVLSCYTFLGRDLELVSGYSGAEAKKVIAEHPDVAVILLDVVMETDDAGLQVVKFVRETLNNKLVRIVLRTGQPGLAPESDVINNYDINDYREKTDLSAGKLSTVITSALRSYHDLLTIKELVISNDQLEQKVQERTLQLSLQNDKLQQEISERVEAERALAESQIRLLSIVNNSPAMIYLKNIEGEFILVNDRFMAVFGVSSEEILGKKQLNDLAYDEVESIRSHENKVIAAKVSMQFEESFNIDGQLVNFISVKFPLFNESGELYRICSISTDITEHKIQEGLIRKKRLELEDAQRIANIGSWEWFVGSRMVEVSKNLLRIFDLEEDEVSLPLVRLRSFILAEDQVKVGEVIEKSMRGMLAYRCDYRLKTQGGEVKHICEQGEFNDENGRIRLSCIIRDITEQRSAEERMQKLSNAVEQTADMVFITNSQGLIEYANPSFEKVTGYSAEEVFGRSPKVLKSGKQDAVFYQRLWSKILSGEVFSGVFVNRKKDGTIYYEEKMISPVTDYTGKITHFVSTGKDITERIENERRVNHMAHHDALTGLPNRVLFNDRLEQALRSAKRNNSIVAVLFIDLDRFKVINDSLGHDVGDKLLKEISSRLISAVRNSDTVSRLGGDEFAVLLQGVRLKQDIESVANSILAKMKEEVLVDEHCLYGTMSIGISTFPHDGEDSRTLLKKSDVAMYRAKESGRNCFRFYTKEDDAKATERLSMETCLRQALLKKEFRMVYQPQVSLVTGKVVGFESLIRWQHPELGTVVPTQFIPLLEDSGLIVPVSLWILEQVCEQFKVWQESGLDVGKVSVNISPRHFQQKDFVVCIEDVLKKSGLSASNLELEITEGLLLENVNETSSVLHQLNDMGVILSIDDFGTGYSSMSYLKRLPVHTLKIDRSFIVDIGSNPDDNAIVSAIISLAHTLGLSVIAEGVENIHQLRYLRSKKCDELQGYYFSRPVEASAVPAIVEKKLIF